MSLKKKQPKESIQPKFIKSLLEQGATYVSLLSPVFSPLLACLGVRSENYALIIYAVVYFLLAVGWLLKQYRSAKEKVSATGTVPRPTWLWKLLTNNAPYRKEQQLVESSIMVLVPPGKEEVAEKLEKEYNGDGNYMLLFHYINRSNDGKIKEDCGFAVPKCETRSLKDLEDELDSCAGVIFIDDCQWESSYKQTYETVERWSKRNKVLPIISIRADARGKLKYNWSRLKDVTAPNHLLKNRLLAQSANRGKAWFEQAKLYRKVILWSTSVALLILFMSASFSIYNRHQAEVSQNEAKDKIQLLQDKVEELERISEINYWAQLEISRNFFNYRETTNRSSAERLKDLLKSQADRLNKIVATSSGNSSTFESDVIMFSITKKDDDRLQVHEVAATRVPPNNMPFVPENTSDIEGIVACSVLARAFVLWSGEANGMEAKTDNIEAWDFEGKKIGSYVSEKFIFGDIKCGYQKRKKENVHRRLLCAPVGVINTSSDSLPVGAICIASPNNIDFLRNIGTRELILRFGSSLSFSTWDKAAESSINDHN